ncbi:MAG: Maf family protein [Spirochaetota bacterium]
MKIILGSSSPRRKEMVGKIFPSYSVISPDVDETPRQGETPEAFCLRASQDKARAIIERAGQLDYLLICADTIVAIDGLILGKPAERNDAVSMLTRLSGRTHKVETAITLILMQSGEMTEISEAETTEVLFKKLSAQDIEDYISAVHCMDKAGSYAIQEEGGRIVESIEGSRTNVIGFPMGLFYTMLHRLNIEPGEFR